MPYRVTWSDVATNQLRNLPPMQFAAVRKMVGSFPHDRWLNGRPFRRSEFAAPKLMMFHVEGLALVYRLDEVKNIVEIYTILDGD